MNEWTKETIEAFQRHIPRDNVKREKTIKDSETIKEFRRLMKEKDREHGYKIPECFPYPITTINFEDYIPAMLDRSFVINRKTLNSNYSKLKEINDMPPKEKVLVFPREIFEKLGSFTGVSTVNICREGTPLQPNPNPEISSASGDSSSLLPEVSQSNFDGSVPFLQNPVFQASLTYMDREEAETNENFLQLIPYCVFKCNDKFLIYQRTKKGGESRLHDKWSLGVGGHISSEDGNTNTSYEIGMQRELNEEVSFYAETNLGKLHTNEVLGLLYDNSNAVGRVHFGVIHLITINENISLEFKDEALDKGQWVGYDWLLENVEKFENWSQLTIEYLG